MTVEKIVLSTGIEKWVFISQAGNEIQVGLLNWVKLQSFQDDQIIDIKETINLKFCAKSLFP